MAKVKPNSIKIATDANISFGRPRLVAKGIAVRIVVAMLESNSVQEVADWYELTEAQVRACLRYACRAVEEKGQRTLEER